MTKASLNLQELPLVRGRYTENAPLGEVGWFRAGGTAEVLFKPEDKEDLVEFLTQCPADIPVTVLGVLSNTIIRDGGVRGVVIRPGREFANIDVIDDVTVSVGASAIDVNVAKVAAEAGIAGLEFLSGVPGSIGGALRMNAGAYGTETKDVLIEAEIITRQGQALRMPVAMMGMGYRHSNVPEDYIFTGAVLRGQRGDREKIEAHIAEIKAKRSETQPIKARTGGSTFANPKSAELAAAGLPEGLKAWQLIDRAGGRGLTIGGAQMSELHCNFMINTGTATASDLEMLGEEIRRRVEEKTKIMLRWEIKRIGEAVSSS
ncbi:MAG: murB [Micavibrio sp.]|nr:murB [Micavibrio sp.]